MKKIIIVFFCLPLLLAGCGEKNDEKFGIVNIVKASVSVIRKKGITALSAESINEEIELQYFNPEDILQRRATLRDREDDKSLNYRMIFEDTIENEKYRESREKTNPFRK